MTVEALFEKLKGSMVALDEKETLAALSALISENVPPKEIIGALNECMSLVTKMFQDGIYYMSGLLLANEIMRVSMEKLIPLILRGTGNEKRGLVLLGTIEGDIHELGKNMAAWFLRADGFEVVDLGVDIPPRVFLKEILLREPDVVGVSLLMASSVQQVKRLVGLVREVYTDRPPPPIFVGCSFLQPDSDKDTLSALMEDERKFLEVEYVVHDALDTVDVCRELVKRKKKEA
ncbi:MAG: cobalamin-dependent protein [Deltaproteobacteria bacterium]|jgi:methanogenic corrinoid protein MtbC1|nr:cobalamin-dependent protein [Deltaproteobacteria bacterium]